jgi:hypothetical protein
MRWLALVPLLAGCDFLWRLEHLDPLDAQPPLVDSEFKNVDVGMCGGTVVGYAGRKGMVQDGLIQICIPAPPPKGDYELLDGFDTDGPNCDQVFVETGMTQLCVITAQSITISLNVDIKGSRPLVLAAADSVLVHGNINIAARQAGDKGPGSDYGNCAATAGGNATNGTGGGGGGGGSFATLGGNGGNGYGGNNQAGGTASQVILSIDRVRGGCAGGSGGHGVVHGASGGAGGASGGAVYIAAGVRIDLAANINASGAGGTGGDLEAPAAIDWGGGGGGGGSGGMIVLDAPAITTSGETILFADGGGGGSGGGSATANPGSDPTALHYNMAAPGGAMTVGGSAGGPGGYNAVRGQAGGALSKSGGGGGGGVGYIVLYTAGAMPSMFTSPAVRLNP